MKITITHDHRDADAAHSFTKYAAHGLGFAVLYQDSCETIIAHSDFMSLDYAEQKAAWNYIIDNELNVRISWIIAHSDFMSLDYAEQKAVWNYIIDNELNVRISWIYIPQAGDVVAMVRGRLFSDGRTQRTVERVEVVEGHLRIWLVETKTWVGSTEIVLVHHKIEIGE